MIQLPNLKQHVTEIQIFDHKYEGGRKMTDEIVLERTCKKVLTGNL